MIVSAKPTMNPFSTGSEMKEARNPRRNSPARIPSAPTSSARPAVSAAESASPEMPATAAPESAAVAAIGPTTRCRELPNSA